MRQLWENNTQGKLCVSCTVELKSGLRQFDAAKEFREKVRPRKHIP